MAWRGSRVTKVWHRRAVPPILAATLALAFLAGSAGAVHAGLLDLLFGGRSYPPAYDYLRPRPLAPPETDLGPRSRRRSVDEHGAPSTVIESPPLLQISTCCKNGEDPMKAILHDHTLVRGDVVMTPQGLRVFNGSRAPHQLRDFLPLDKGRITSAEKRKHLLARDR